MTTEAGYRPMRNDAAGFSPADPRWAYVLDEAPPDTWRELVALRERTATWPFAPRHGGHYHARLSPDWAFRAWGTEYALASWHPGRPHEVTVRLVITRPGDRDGWTGTVCLDLAAGTRAWVPCHADLDKPVPPDVAAEIESKAGKLAAFFAEACEQWRQARPGDRPAQAYDWYTPDWDS